MSRFFALQASGQYHDIGVNEFFYELQRVHDTSRTMAECCAPTRYFNFRRGLAWAQVHFTIYNITHLLIIYNPIPWGPIYALFTPGRWCQVLGLVKLSPQNLQQLKGKPFKPSAWPRGRLLFYKAYIYYFILLLIFHYLACYHLLQVRVLLFYKALTEVPLHNYHPQHIYFLDSQLQGPTIYLEA